MNVPLKVPLPLKNALILAVITGGLATGAAGVALAGAGNDGSPQPAPPYQAPRTNARGQTYGSALGALTYAQVPDLVSVWDNEDELGYATKVDIFPSVAPRGPSGAAGPQQADLTTKSVTVFESDGITVIGTYGGWRPQATRTPTG